LLQKNNSIGSRKKLKELFSAALRKLVNPSLDSFEGRNHKSTYLLNKKLRKKFDRLFNRRVDMPTE